MRGVSRGLPKMFSLRPRSAYREEDLDCDKLWIRDGAVELHPGQWVLRASKRPPKKKKADELPEDLTKLTVAKLKVLLKARDLDQKGKKAELIARLEATR